MSHLPKLEEIVMKSSGWKFGLGAVAVAAVVLAGAAAMSSPAGAAPVMTVYKTPT